MLATRSFSPTFMTVTPCVLRPSRLMVSTCVRMRMPSSVTSISSWPGATSRTAATFPVFSVMLSVRTPCPPRPLRGYCSSSVRLPKPRSVMASICWPSASTASAPTTQAPSRRRMPRTPPLMRLALRSSRTAKRMACPSLEMSARSSPSRASRAPMSSSPSSRRMAILPLRRTSSNSLRGVFLACPRRVASTRKSCS